MNSRIQSIFCPWSLSAFLLPLALFVSTLAPSVTFYDSGEFISATYHLSSAHSPGYPLFMLFAKPFTLLPVGSIAFRVNLATAFSAAIACYTAFLLAKTLLSEIRFSNNIEFSSFALNSISLAASLLFATSPRLWLQTNHDKPYPLLAAMVAISFFLLIRWRKKLLEGDDCPSFLYGVAFIAGVASGAHQTIILFIPAWFLFVLLTDRGFLRRIREIVLMTAFGVAGGAVQLYLPVRASVAPPQNWGDTSSLSSFLWHLLRRGYPEDPHARDWPLLFKQLSAFSIPHEFGWVGLLLLLTGAFAIWRLNRPLIMALAVSLLSYWAVIAGYFNPQQESIFLTEAFYTPLYLLSAVVIAAGLYMIAATGVAASEEPERYGRLHYLLLVFFFMIIVCFQSATNFKANDQSRNYVAHDYAANILRPLPEEAVLFTWGDSGAFPIWYMQGVERMRPDADLLHIPHLPFAWYRKEFSRITPYFADTTVKDRSAELLFAETASNLAAMRPVLMDYSTRHSLSFSGDEPCQYGVVFIMDRPYCDASGYRQKIWGLNQLGRLSMNVSWSIDGDTEKGIMIFAHSMLEAAEDAGRRSDPALCAMLLGNIEKMVPSWRSAVEITRRSYGCR